MLLDLTKAAASGNLTPDTPGIQFYLDSGGHALRLWVVSFVVP